MIVSGSRVLGSFAALAVSSAALGGFVFFTDPVAFQAALDANGKISKGFWDFSPHNVGLGFIGGFEDPLNFQNIPFDKKLGVFYWDEMPLDNIQFQSNLNPNGQGGPNPRGIAGLAFATPPFFGLDNNILVANTFVDSFDILSGVPVGDNHTAMALQVVSLSNPPQGLPVNITVWDKNEENSTRLVLPGFQGIEKQFVGILATDGLTIGRVNIYDTGSGPGSGAEGISSIEVYIPAPGSLALLGLSGLFVRRRRRR